MIAHLWSVSLITGIGRNDSAFDCLLECEVHHGMIPLCGCSRESIIPKRNIEIVHFITGKFFEWNVQLLEIRYDSPSVILLYELYVRTEILHL